MVERRGVVRGLFLVIPAGSSVLIADGFLLNQPTDATTVANLTGHEPSNQRTERSNATESVGARFGGRE